MSNVRKIFCILIFLFVSGYALGVEISTYWNDQNQKVVQVNCSYKSSDLCLQTCNEEYQCKVLEPICIDCVGTSIIMTYYFQEMGRLIYNTGHLIDPYFAADMLSSDEFISLSARSIYNHIDSFNSFSLQRRFRSMCNDGTFNPIVFFSRENSGTIGQPKWVWCESGIYEAANYGNVSFEESYSDFL